MSSPRTGRRQPSLRNSGLWILALAFALIGTLIIPAEAGAAATSGTDLTGRWLLQYSQTGLNPHPYTILLEHAGDDACTAANLAIPCYGGLWWNVTAARFESRILFSAVRSGDQLILDGADPAGTSDYHYHAKAGATSAPFFAGTYEGTVSATFTLARTPYAPGEISALTAHPAALDLEGSGLLEYTPKGLPLHPYTINLTRQPDDLCADAYALRPPCFGGEWYNVPAARFESYGYFSATASAGRLLLWGADGVGATTSPQHYQGATTNLGSRTFVGTFNNDAGTLPADFTLTISPPPGQAPLAPTSEPIVPNSYIVMSKTPPNGQRVPVTARAIAAGVKLTKEYSWAIGGFAATLSPAQLDVIRQDPDTAIVDYNSISSLSDSPAPPNYMGSVQADIGLQRIQERQPGVNGGYAPPGTGRGVKIYVLDGGVWGQHDEFTDSTGTRVIQGDDEISRPPDNTCQPHGTHVAGIAAGRTYGVAVGATIVSVRVASCDGFVTDANLIDGLNWVSKAADTDGRSSVVNISLGQDGQNQPWSSTVHQAMVQVLNAGTTMVIAAGNQISDACKVNFPAGAIVVGAIDPRNDTRASFSSYGACVDMYAPGVAITSSSPGEVPPGGTGASSQTLALSGTSMAAPFVAGAAALYLAAHNTATPAAVKSFLLRNATSINVSDPDGIAPAKLLYVPPMYVTSIGLETIGQGDGKKDTTDAEFSLNSQNDRIITTPLEPGMTRMFARLNLDGQSVGQSDDNRFTMQLLSPYIGIRDLENSDLHLTWNPACHDVILGCTTNDNWSFNAYIYALFGPVPDWCSSQTPSTTTAEISDTTGNDPTIQDITTFPPPLDDPCPM